MWMKRIISYKPLMSFWYTNNVRIENVFSDCISSSRRYCSDLWAHLEANSRRWVRRQGMSDGQVCRVGNVERPAGWWWYADDRRCLRVLHGSLPGTVALCSTDTGGLSRQACTGSGLPHRASASRRIIAASVHGRAGAYSWRCVLQRSALLAVCLSQRHGSLYIFNFIHHRNDRRNVLKKQAKANTS